jgi:hypothetical protein
MSLKPLYGNNKTQIIGYFPPAPSSELDVLLDECCVAVENMFKAFKTPTGQRRLATELNQDAGQHSTVLTDGVSQWGTQLDHAGIRSWITAGTLRTQAELTTVLNAFYRDMTAKVRMRKVSPDWQLDNDALIVLSSRFGLQTPRTFEELAAKRALDSAERQRQTQQQQADERERRRTYEASPVYAEKLRLEIIQRAEADRLEWKAGLVTNTVNVIEPPPTFKDRDNPTHEEKLDAAITREDRKYLRVGFKQIVDQTTFAPSTILRIWKEAGKEYTAIADTASEDFVEKMPRREDYAAGRIMETFNEKAEGFGPCELPKLLAGERRLRFAWPALMAFLKTPEYEQMSTVVRLGDQCGAEPLSVVLDVVVYPFLRSRCERVEQEDGSFVGDENVRRD